MSVWKYIFVSEDVKYSGEEVIDVWQGRIRGIKLEIEKVLKNQQKQEEWHNENEEWKKKQEDKWAKTEVQLTKSADLLSKILEQKKEVRASKIERSERKTDNGRAGQLTEANTAASLDVLPSS